MRRVRDLFCSAGVSLVDAIVGIFRRLHHSTSFQNCKQQTNQNWVKLWSFLKWRLFRLLVQFQWRTWLLEKAQLSVLYIVSVRYWFNSMLKKYLTGASAVWIQVYTVAPSFSENTNRIVFKISHCWNAAWFILNLCWMTLQWKRTWKRSTLFNVKINYSCQILCSEAFVPTNAW